MALSVQETAIVGQNSYIKPFLMLNVAAVARTSNEAFREKKNPASHFRLSNPQKKLQEVSSVCCYLPTMSSTPRSTFTSSIEALCLCDK